MNDRRLGKSIEYTVYMSELRKHLPELLRLYLSLTYKFYNLTIALKRELEEMSVLIGGQRDEYCSFRWLRYESRRSHLE